MYYLITKPDCIWCDRAKDLLKIYKEDYETYDYQEHPMIPKLMYEAALKSVPQIWYNSKHIGGYAALEDWLSDDT